MTQGTKLIIAALLAALAALGIYAWRQHAAAEQATREAALNTTRMIAEVFRAKGDLRVGQLSGTVIAQTRYAGRLFRPTQETRAPATVNYLLDLSKVDSGRFTWDPVRKTMRVRIPDVTVEAPAIDMAKAEVRQDGVWISRAAGLALQRQAAGRIALRAEERARDEKNLRNARAAAIAAVTRLVRQPLQAVGQDDVSVQVLFPWEGRRSDEEWDRSRRPEEVLGNLR